MINASLAGKSAVNEKVYGYTTLGTRLKQVNKICVSMWPILFGAIVAQAFKMYAAWKVERGIKLIVSSITGETRFLQLTTFQDIRAADWQPLPRH